MVQKIWDEILKNKEVRQNLSRLREIIKDRSNKQECKNLVSEYPAFLENLLQSEEPKTRKNTALLLGDLEMNEFAMSLWRAYEKEETLFVRSSYVAAMQKLEMTAFLKPIKSRLQTLSKITPEENNRKHISEEIQQLNKLLISVEGIKKHKFTGWRKESEIILLANRRHLETVLMELKQLEQVVSSNAKLMSAGIRLKTDALDQLMEIRTWQEMLFLVTGMKSCERDPLKAAETIASSKLIEFLEERHQGEAPFYFRVEVKMQCGSPVPEKCNKKEKTEKQILEEKQKFVKKFIEALEEKSGRQLINTTTDYEIELRLVENKEGRFNVMVKLYTMKDSRFDYRQEVIASSIRPVNAALLVQLAKEYMNQDARVLDPFCGVGTMLIERQKKIEADTSYGLDILEEAIEKGRRNAEEAGQLIHFINRDCFTFTHEYLFDEIFTNMPFVQGRKTPLEIYEIYNQFFKNVTKLIRSGGVMILYTHDKSYVEKLSITSKFQIEKKWQINTKEDTWLYVLKK